MSELNKEGMDFQDIQHADERTRMQLLEAMPTLSAIDRASVTTTWRRLAEKGSTTNSSTPSRDPAPVPQQQQRGGQPPQRAGSAGRGMAKHDSTSFGPTVNSSTFDPVQDYVPPRLEKGGKGGKGGKVQPPVLNVPVMNMGVNGQDVSSLLRTSLDRGDCGTALPLASEMLQTDPIGLIHMLHEYLPQLSVEQLKTILGIGVPMGQEGGGSPTSPQQYSPRGNTPRGGASPARQGSMTPRGGNTSGNGRSFRSNNNEGSPGVEMSVQPTLNGQPLSAGQVLTAHSMQAQYGARFTATCNGRSLIFPYCVQRGDRIVVRSAQERLL